MVIWPMRYNCNSTDFYSMVSHFFAVVLNIVSNIHIFIYIYNCVCNIYIDIDIFFSLIGEYSMDLDEKIKAYLGG